MILVIDNYDSFTFNLVHLLGSRPGAPAIRVVRNDALEAEAVAEWSPSHVVLSPGPGRPEDSGLSLQLSDALPDTPILGVCLGHQALAHAHGATVSRTPRPKHGDTVSIDHDGSGPLEGLPPRIDVALYHSLAVQDHALPECLLVTARAATGEIMALRHRDRPHYGVQFHPESFMTTAGAVIAENFLRRP